MNWITYSKLARSSHLKKDQYPFITLHTVTYISALALHNGTFQENYNQPAM